MTEQTEQTTVTARFAAAVAVNIRVENARKGLTMTEVATGINMDRTSLYKRLSGEVEWRYSELLAVAKFLGVLVAEIAPETLGAELLADQ